MTTYISVSEHATGGYHMTARTNSAGPWPIGGCSDHEPHPTAEAADDCWMSHVVDSVDFDVPQVSDDEQRRCAADDCEAWTQRSYRPLTPQGDMYGPWWLCDDHAARVVVVGLLSRRRG